MIQAELNRIIDLLQCSLDDAAKCDDGRAGTPGTRLRKCAQDAREMLKNLRASVLAHRD